MIDEPFNKNNVSVMHKMMGDCHNITKLISFSYEQPLTTTQKLKVSSHTMMCTACRNYQKNSKTMDKMIAQHKNITQEIVNKESK